MSQATSAHPKRNRTQLSCTPCRHAKLKCDRVSPCSQCLKRDRPGSCVFPEPAQRRRPAVTMRDRVRHLEGLVKGALAAVPLGENEGEASGQVLTDSDESRYVGSTHWAAILEDIEEVKDYFADAGDVSDDEAAEEVVSYTMLTFNPHSPISKEELLGRLPEKNIVDGLVRKYFNGHSPSLHLIHKPTFQKEYKSFWAAPSDAPFIWVGLIYAMMALAAFSSLGAAETPI